MFLNFKVVCCIYTIRHFLHTYIFLQIQLEKIRQAETEVRWQQEEDIDDCNNCKQQFSVTKRKVKY